MGGVWKAFDSNLKTNVAVKTLLDSFDREAFERFEEECRKLAGLPHHPNIIQIMDAGQIEQDGRQKPYFVMPLLEGVTLAQLLQRKLIERPRLEFLLSKKTPLSDFLSGPEERLSCSRIIEIIGQVCKGLQVAHENGIIHRDIKPSNIFILTDFSVQIIDFGVARLANTKSGTVGLKGTLPYMSPEQVQFKPLTTASDIFSLGVVCYEALVGERPFMGKTQAELTESIVWHNPKAPHEVASVPIAISQGVFKALAKQSENRYLTASAFGEHLQRALLLENRELFPLPRPRLVLAAEYHAKGNDEAALKLLESLHVEGITHPDISELQQQVDAALRRKRVEEGLASARTLMEVRDYEQAVRELNRVLAEDPSNATAIALVKEIEARRTEEDVEELFRQTRRQIESYDFESARRTLERVRKRRPRETRLAQFLTELDRLEEEYQQLQRDRNRLYDAARSAFERRDISSARSHVRKLAALDDQHPEVPNPRQSDFNNMRSQVEAEQQAIDAALEEVNRLKVGNRLTDALKICLQKLDAYPANEHFLHLQFELEELQREALVETIRETDALLRAEPDLMKQEKLLESKTQEYPSESHFRQALDRTRKLRAAVDEIATRARMYESEKAFQEAQQEWQKLKTIYARYPGLDAELSRLTTRRADQEKRQRKEKIAQQIHRDIDHRKFQIALTAIAEASMEFPDDPELKALEALAASETTKLEKAETLLSRGNELCGKGDFVEGLAVLREAYGLDCQTPAVIAGLVDGLLLEANYVENENPATAEKNLREVLAVDPDHAIARDRLDLLLERRHDELVSICIANSLHLERAGDLLEAFLVVDRAIRDQASDRRIMDGRLAERKERLEKKLSEKGIPYEVAVSAESSTPSADNTNSLPTAEVQPSGTWTDFEMSGVSSNIGDRDPRVIKGHSSAPEDVPKKRTLLPRKWGRWHLWAAGAVVPVAALIILFWPQSPPPEKAVARAIVQVEPTLLLREPRSNSVSIRILHKSERVNVLERVTSDRPYVRVQFISPKVTSRPGFVARQNLSDWTSDDLGFCWEIVVLHRSKDGAGIQERLAFAEELISFSRKFSTSVQADLARIEAAQIYVGAATELKDAGRPFAEWVAYLDKAEAILKEITHDDNGAVVRIGTLIAELRKNDTSDPQQSPPEVVERQRHLKQLYNEAASLFSRGKGDEAKKKLKEIFNIDPTYELALRLQDSINFFDGIPQPGPPRKF
jgi:serine/threonine-protein kinase